MAQLIYKAAYYLSQWKHFKHCLLSPQYCPVSIVLAFAGFAKWLDFLKVVRMVFWSGVVGPGTNDELSLARSRFALTVALRAQKLDL